MAKQAFTIEEFSSAYMVGRTKTYEEITSGRLATYQVGRRRYISAQAAAAWQESLEAASKQEHEGAGAAA